MYQQKESINLKTQEKSESFQAISESIKQANVKILETFKSFILLQTELNWLEHDISGLTAREMLKWLLNSLSASW